jgi:hypothetical protein
VTAVTAGVGAKCEGESATPEGRVGVSWICPALEAIHIYGADTKQRGEAVMGEATVMKKSGRDEQTGEIRHVDGTDGNDV